MSLLALRGRGTRLDWRAGWWLVQRGGFEVRRVRGPEVREVHLYGLADLSPEARSAALGRGVSVAWLTADGRFRGRLVGPGPSFGARVLAQVRWLADEGRCLTLAKQVVVGKLTAQRSLLLTLQRRKKSDVVAASALRLRALLRRVEAATTLDAVRGVEGEGARAYFEAFGVLLEGSPFVWQGRTRRPPRDPINACLSFGYTLLAIRVDAAVRQVGLLPGLGALHAPARNQDALVFDLVEELRAPVVDRLVLRLIGRRQLQPEDFEDPGWRDPAWVAPRGRDDPSDDAANEAPPVDADDGADDDTDADDVPAGAGDPDGGPAGGGAPEAGGTSVFDEDPPVAPDLGAPDLGAPAPAATVSARPSGAVYLGPMARKLFVQQFQARLAAPITDGSDGSRPTVAWVIERQARRMAALFEGRTARYEPFEGG